MSDTQTALAEYESNKRLDVALKRLLHDLKPFMRAYARTPEEQAKIPEIDIVWVTDLDGGPGQVVLDALIANPELWLHALPEEVCIVPRKGLDTVMMEPLAASHLINWGESIVSTHATRSRQKDRDT